MIELDPTRVGRWMTAALVTVTPETSAQDAFVKMHSERIRHLVVIEDGALLGIVSNRDVIRCVLGLAPGACFEPLRETSVKDIMTPSPLQTATPFTSVREASEIMCREKISAMPVLDGHTLVGIVTSEDLLWSHLEQ